ncbi:hypothetical protein [Frankia tisae]|nr:hypothetical protein [Frankia tisae]
MARRGPLRRTRRPGGGDGRASATARAAADLSSVLAIDVDGSEPVAS